MDPKKKYYLFKQCDNFCSVPWNHLKVSMDGDISTCVNGTEVFGNLNEDNIENILQNDATKKIKTDLYNNVKTQNCQKCLSFENSVNNTSYYFLRDLYNPMFLKNNIDYSNDSDFMLSGLDLHWSSLCNLKCITCWANQSSSIAKEQGKPILHTSNRSADVFIDYVINNQYNLKEIYLSGGEPTLINHNLRLLKKLDKNNESLQIRINTNMMFKHNNKIIEELKKFPNVLFTISADGMQDRFNYIRRGANWKTFIENLESLISGHFKWRVNSTFFVCNSVYMLDTFRFFKKNYSINDFTINQCMGHDYLRARNLPEFLKTDCMSQFSLEINQTKDRNLIGQLQNCIKELHNDKTQSYTSYLDSIDDLEGTDWKTTFTELANE